MSTKVVCVLAAAAFVGVFRLHATGDDTPRRAPAPLSAARSSVLESDTKPGAAMAPPARLVPVAALPALHREPQANVAARRAKARSAAAERPARTAAREAVAGPQAAAPTATPTGPPTAPPTATPASRPVTAAPRAPASAAPYVGKRFDSGG